MATKTHESLMKAITKAQEALDAAKAEYKAFCKENPLTLKKTLTPKELQNIEAKNKAAKEAEAASTEKAESTAEE